MSSNNWFHYSVGRKDDYNESGEIVSENILRCVQELEQSNGKIHHTFMMVTNYAKDGAKVFVVDENNMNAVIEQSREANHSIDLSLLDILRDNQIDVVLSDSIVLKKIPDQRIALSGASGDAHPILLVDDLNGVCAYVAGSHAGIAAGVVEKTIDAMLELGADKSHIHTIVGPGLGPNSYEYGPNAAEKIGFPEELVLDKDKTELDEYSNFENSHYCAEIVLNHQDEPRCLLHMTNIIRYKIGQLGLLPEQVHDIQIDTMGFDLYDENRNYRRQVNFHELNKSGFLFFGARRIILERHGENNSGLHNTVGRHLASVVM